MSFPLIIYQGVVPTAVNEKRTAINENNQYGNNDQCIMEEIFQRRNLKMNF